MMLVCEGRDRKERVDREEGSRDIDKDFAELKPKRASARNASDAIRRQSQAGEGGEGFSGPAPQASTDDKRAVKGAAVQYPFFDKVKARLRSRDTYQEFLKCLNIFSQEIISRGELQSLVGDILGKHADLMEGFNEFLTHCENVEGYLAGVFSGRKLGDFAEGAPVKAVKTEREGERDRNREKDREREKDRDREKEERDRERDVKEREREVKPAHGVKGEGAHKVTSHKDKFVNKPISELDLSNCERCTPSYRLLPKNYPKPLSSHRTALGTSVLNDNWVSVTSGSEDYSFKHMRKNQYEESLFRCEDDRFELDMLLESTAVTAKLVGEYTQRQEGENVKAEALPPVEECLSAINLRCIERIYGDHGLDILEVLRKNTSRALPVIHSRLVQKEEEWMKCREDMNKVWSEVYAKNAYKALDHRSFYFRQQDKKALSTKGLLTEIKEVNERRRREDDTMLAIAAGNRRPLVPDLRYEFEDASIHDDIYEIIKYSSEEISSSPDHMEKIMRMWRSFLEPMLGISSRTEGAEDMEEAAKSKGLEGEGRDGNAMESGGGSEGDETSSPEGDVLGNDGEIALGTGVEGVDLDGAGAGDTNGDAERAGVIGERIGGDGSSAENAGTGEDENGREGANEVRAMDMDAGTAEGTAARTEGSGWLQLENSGARQSSKAGERGETEARSIGWQGEGRVSRSVVVGGNGSGGRGTVEREEGELSPTSEHEDRNKVKSSPRRGVEKDGTVKMLGQDVEDGEGVGGTEMDHDQGLGCFPAFVFLNDIAS
jgi:paired amphipathic helix protein Sin3a